MNFWSIDEEREICGEPECGDGYTFINNSPTDETYTHEQSWTAFEKFMTDRGYTSINRYPTVARWRDDVEFTGASIYCFQPYVVSGEAEPPAKELIIPQPSLRFNDVDNVGITGRHYTNFTMIGQTCFQPPEKYDQDRYFKDMLEFTVEKLGIPKQKLVLHEDSWGGGGNLGACMEFFVDGLELFNQVYMFYERTQEGYEELDLKVLDMGMGHERITWISNGTETSYESVMPKTLEKMKKQTGLEVNQSIWESFLPYSSELNVDEVEDIDQKWQEVAEKMGMDAGELKDEIKPSAALYSVAEHTRALIFALADGKIPSNTGGGHNLRMIYRRAKDFIERYDWDLKMTEIAKWHAEELENLYPELKKSIQEIEEILEVEAEKYEKSRKKAEKKLSSLDSQPSIEKMTELYESHGVSPEMMEEHGYKVPEDFYTKVGGSEEALNQAQKGFDIREEVKTEKLYYEKREPYRNSSDSDAEDFSFMAEVKQIIQDQWIILDRTLFYPEGGGQSADTGRIDEGKVENVQKQGNAILHKVPKNNLDKGDKVECIVNGQRRKQLTQHHSTTHIVNAASREILGNHIYQAGANKTTEKARLDLTHYEKPSKQELRQIESKVQETINQNHKINVIEEKKSQAEQKYGFRIYQGGAPPGNNIRLIEIEEVDIEACGGTHLTTTSHAEDFVLTGCKRIQDGTIRMEYKAGKQARKAQRIARRHCKTSCSTAFGA
jgi:Alanyl-tRNA synthetase